MTTATPTVTASIPTLTDTGVRGGVDVDITITLGKRSWDGSVTLLCDHTGWTSWGEPANWADSNILVAADELETDELPANEILQLICGEAAAAIRSDPDIATKLVVEDQRIQDEDEDEAANS